jgi:hypothetical protein
MIGSHAMSDFDTVADTIRHHRDGPASVMHAVLNHAHGPVVTVPSDPEGSSGAAGRPRAR